MDQGVLPSQLLREAVTGQPWVQRFIVDESGDGHVYVEDAAEGLPALMQLCLARGLELTKVTYSRPTLDDVFLLHTGRELRELDESA